MNTKQIITRTATLFAGLALAGIIVAVSSQIVPNTFAQKYLGRSAN